MRRLSFASLVLLAAVPLAHGSAIQCESATVQPPGATVLMPVARELVAANPQLGSHRGVLAPAFDERQSLESVLLRLKMEGCKAAAATPAQPGADGYVKRTEYDNKPYRFNMTQNGKRMTADDFDAWLQANGYSAGRRADPAAAVEAAAPAVPATATTPEQ